MSSPIWEPLEQLARELVKNGKILPIVEVRQGQVCRITVRFGEGVERTWTMKELQVFNAPCTNSSPGV